MSRFIDEHRGRFGVEPICRTLGVSASAYYHRRTGACSARAVGDQFGLEAVDEALGERVVEGVADRADRAEHPVIVEYLREGLAGVLGGFKWSLQRLDGEELRCKARGGVGLIGRGERRPLARW